MADLYLFIETFWLLFWPLLPATAFFGLDELAKVYFPGLARYLDMIPARARRYIEVLALVVVTFYAGFLAWQQEHKTVLKLQDQIANSAANSHSAKYFIDQVVLDGSLDGTGKKLHWTYANQGDLDGLFPTTKVYVSIQDGQNSQLEDANFKETMNKVHKDLSHQDNEFSVGAKLQGSVPIVLPDMTKRFEDKKYKFL